MPRIQTFARQFAVYLQNKLIFGLLDMNISEFFTTQFSNKRSSRLMLQILPTNLQIMSDITVLVADLFMFGIFF